MITSEVERVDEGYLVTGRVVLPTGSRIAAFSELAEDAGTVPDAAVRLSIRLREKIGESLRAIRAE